MLQRSVLVVTALLLAASLVSATFGAATEPLIGERQARIFQQACAHCHVRPDIGVPMLGDVDAWAPRRAQGFEVLVAHTVEGFRDMPPLGTCSFCTEDDLRRLAAFLAGYSALPASEPEAEEGAR